MKTYFRHVKIKTDKYNYIRGSNPQNPISRKLNQKRHLPNYRNMNVIILIESMIRKWFLQKTQHTSLMKMSNLVSTYLSWLGSCTIYIFGILCYRDTWSNSLFPSGAINKYDKREKNVLCEPTNCSENWWQSTIFMMTYSEQIRQPTINEFQWIKIMF